MKATSYQIRMLRDKFGRISDEERSTVTYSEWTENRLANLTFPAQEPNFILVSGFEDAIKPEHADRRFVVVEAPLVLHTPDAVAWCSGGGMSVSTMVPFPLYAGIKWSAGVKWSADYVDGRLMELVVQQNPHQLGWRGLWPRNTETNPRKYKTPEIKAEFIEFKSVKGDADRLVAKVGSWAPGDLVGTYRVIIRDNIWHLKVNGETFIVGFRSAVEIEHFLSLAKGMECAE